MKISEQAVFRWVVIVAVAALSVIAVAAVAGSLAGSIWGLILVAAGAWHAYAWFACKRREG